ncbi:MAG TPA: class I SAM-dependent methyltransferase [Chthoniobacterales bacterium]
MDYDAYFRELADYYNYSRIPSKVMTGAAEIRTEFNQTGTWVWECADSLQATLAKRRVLEIACGSGRWTQFVADVAEHVLATDPCPALLEYGRRLNLPNIDWVECDAFSLHKIEGTFNGACHINFMNHVPRELLPRFIDKLHDKLEPDSVVFCASQRWQGSAEEPWYEKLETGDMVSLRHHDDGRPIEVVDTFFTEDLLREVLSGKTRELQITLKPWWWFACYRVA